MADMIASQTGPGWPLRCGSPPRKPLGDRAGSHHAKPSGARLYHQTRTLLLCGGGAPVAELSHESERGSMATPLQ